ncbi:hypothetical protein BJX68DRAFT_271571 [Aspergillus pseudodeflectus]|uniref:Uncharacterized protein n=1 Tax=Aspergillus pseudodeflectus TaxID=176178 RepID=A0ABR4JKP0_9EURO
MLLNPYVTSAFRQHSALSSVNVVGNIARICAFPLLAELSDVFGWAEIFSFFVTFHMVSYFLYASSTATAQYFVAAVLYAIGSTGFVLTQQVFIANATNPVNRAFCSTLPESITTIPALYLGSIIGERFPYNGRLREGFCINFNALAPPQTPAPTSRRSPKHRRGHLADDYSRAGCANFAIMLGFWAPSASWLLYVRATELTNLPSSHTRGSTRIEDIRRKVASYVPHEDLEEMEINNRYSIPWHYPHTGKWMHLSLFVVYRGVPFVVQRDGKLNVDEWRGVIALKEHDEKYKGKCLSPTRLAPSEAVPDIERALKELVRSRVGKVVQRLSR